MVVVEYAKKFIGVPYIWGGEHPAHGFDCSGFVLEVLKSVGAGPRGDATAQGIYNYMEDRGHAVSPTKGALIFYGKSETEISHVALLISEDQIIEAGGGSSECYSLEKAIENKAFIRVRPYNKRPDIVRVFMPDYPQWVWK